MRPLLVSIALLLLAATPAGAACVRRGETVVARGERLIIVVDESHLDRFGEGDLAYVACSRFTGRRRLLLSGFRDDMGATDAQQFAVAGRFVAFVSYSWDHYGNHPSAVELVDAGSGRHTHVPADATVTDLAIDARGRLAYRTSNGERATITVIDRGETRTVDDGRAQRLRHPRIAGGELRWLSAGRVRREPLSPADRCGGKVSGTTVLAVAPQRLCARAVGEWRPVIGSVLALSGHRAAVLAPDGSVRVLDVLSGESGPPTDPIGSGGDAWLASSGTLVIVEHGPAGYVLSTRTPDGTRTDLDRWQDNSLRYVQLLDDDLSWNPEGARRTRHVRVP